jgi:hypothetical protein
LSLAGATTDVAGLGEVSDEDVLQLSQGVWSVYFDGSAYGLGASPAQDVDAFDLPSA